MRLIDEKGRLFGKINLIDLIIILVIVALVCGIGFKLFFSNDEASPSEPSISTQAKVDILLKTVNYEVAGGIEEGDTLIINNAESDIKVDSIVVKDSMAANPDSNGIVVLSPNPLHKDMTVTVFMDVSVSSGGIAYKGEMLKINNNFNVETNDFCCVGKIIDITYDE